MSECAICKDAKRRMFVEHDIAQGMELGIIAMRRRCRKSDVVAHAAHVKTPAQKTRLSSIPKMRDEAKVDAGEVSLTSHATIGASPKVPEESEEAKGQAEKVRLWSTRTNGASPWPFGVPRVVPLDPLPLPSEAEVAQLGIANFQEQQERQFRTAWKLMNEAKRSSNLLWLQEQMEAERFEG